MNEVTRQQPERQSAFQQPAGYAANPDVKDDEVAVNTNMSPRNIALAAIEEKTDQMHLAQIKDDIEGDPGAKVLHDRMQEAQDAATAQGIKDGLLPAPESVAKPPLDPDGAAYREKMHPGRPTPPAALPEDDTDPTVLPEELQDDPLAEHIVMDDDQPMFSLKVNGQHVLMPLSEARRRLQIGTAAEIRMQNAAAKEKNVDERERRVIAGEEALALRVRVEPIQVQPVPVQPDLSEQEIRLQAKDVFTTAFSGSEEDAAEKLTKLLIATRIPPVQQVAPIDEAGIVNRAAKAAVGAVTAVTIKQDLIVGLETFSEKYPEIMNDVNLYRMADSMTDEIAIEHPGWLKSQVILESGKRTSEWIENLKGTPVVEEIIDPVVPTDDETISEQPQPPTQIRQERKRTLVKIPQAVTAVQPPAEPEPVQQTPQEALDEVRRGRGQAT